ncbi:DNA topoisomerase IB [Roseobacter sp. YSTF-M11]|uniref:DNA topoisomerase IB n=1 Tax=Roseobacter insulae TaxID=2859783 RepID=A0A9X1FUP7_9RHOB|nr:DNA topoisomerase IB [Roseobacter insulae]MBW4707455.1 DNA topoisomerase IB [Roseobacter insulae]
MSLTYYPDSMPGIRRHRRGRGFTYVAPDNTRIDCATERARIAALAIPPAYDDVWISPIENSHLLATGRDARSRKQYRYHPEWSAEKSATKFSQLVEFGRSLPALRRKIAAGLRGEAGDSALAIAAVLALMDRASLRVGNPVYTRENGSYGATTLKSKHLSITDGTIRLSYTAKGGQPVRKKLNGSALQRALQRCRHLPGKNLITWLDDTGTPQKVRSDEVNAWIEDICGEGMTAKSFRTWNGSVAAFNAACAQGPVTIKDVTETAAEELHNSPTIARNSYIHPQVLELAQMPDAERHAKLDGLDDVENALFRAGEGRLLAYLQSG